MRFVQIIEYRTSRPDDLKAIVDKHRDTINNGSLAVRGTATQDREDPTLYRNIVEFESWESAQENSKRPEIDAFAQDMMTVCDGPPKFYNLDVIDEF